MAKVETYHSYPSQTLEPSASDHTPPEPNWAFHDALDALLRAMAATEWDSGGSVQVRIGKFIGKLKYFVCESEDAHHRDGWFD